jgi:hypothetical protein
MNAYFFNISNEERDSIKNQHTKLYDGYVTLQKTSSSQPLTIEDLAKDKGGITLSNKGNVSTYKNFGINEEKTKMCEQCGLNEEVCKCEQKTAELEDKIDYIEEDEVCEQCEDEEFEEVDDELQESFKNQRNLILEMFNRVNRH